MIAWLTSAGDGWAVAPLWVAAGALLAVVAVLIGLRAERTRQDREAHEASLQLAAAMVGRGATAASALWRASDVAPGRLREALLSAARRSEGLPVYPALSRGRVAEVTQQPTDLA